MLAVITHPGIDPVAIHLGPLAIHWYALSYVAGLLFAVWYMKYLSRQPRLRGANPHTLTPQAAEGFLIFPLLGVALVLSRCSGRPKRVDPCRQECTVQIAKELWAPARHPVSKNH